MCEDSADRLGKGPEEKKRWEGRKTVLSGGTGTQLGDLAEVSGLFSRQHPACKSLSIHAGEAGIPGGTPKFQKETPSIPDCWCSAG